MKTTLLLLLASLSLTNVLHAQGPLTPPAGPPAPSMKTLDQLEPRIPIGPVTTPGNNSNTYRITQPGSYYLTSNLVGESGKNGIDIASPDVTLDLMGFEMRGVPGSLAGINIQTFQNHALVRNGSITAWGAAGINALLGRFERLHATGNGNAGFATGFASTFVDCRADFNMNAGFSSSGRSAFTRCSAESNTSTGFMVGFNSILTNCTAYSNGLHGIYGGAGLVADACSIVQSNGVGIKATSGTVTKCTVNDNSGGGIDVGSGAVTDCNVGGQDSGVGIKVNGGTVSHCSVTGVNGNGIEAGVGSEVSYCSIKSCTGSGIVVDSGSSILNNTACANIATVIVPIGAGVTAIGSGNRIEGNHVTNNHHGLRITGTDNIIVRNTARANTTTNYTIAAGNEAAEVIINPGMNFSNSSPWANYAF